MIIHEFWTFLTDVILSALCFFYAFRLRELLSSEHFSAKLWLPVFVSIGIAALSGAIYHGFRPYLPIPVYNGFRILVLFCLSTTAYLIGMSLLRFTIQPQNNFYKAISLLLKLKLVFFLVFALIQTQFLVAVADYGSTFIVALVVFAFHWQRPASKLMTYGIVVSLVAASIQTLKISPHPSFNHNDLYHVVQILGLHLFYLGSPQLEDR